VSRVQSYLPHRFPIQRAIKCFPSDSFSSGLQKEFLPPTVEWFMSTEPIIAVNRFGLGAAPGELAAAGSDPRGWLTRQINGPEPAIPEFGRLLSSGEALKAYPRWIASLGRARTALGGSSEVAPSTVEGTFREQLGPIMQEEVAARLAVAASTPMPFRERLVWFWSNHFTVSAEKALVFALVGSFEREAIRPHVGGRFS
jgi:uncharacterized protein (DUF1800 family)